MVTVGRKPFLECSSAGDARFSAMFARPTSLNGRTIEEGYQALKRFEDGTTGLSIKRAKGRRPVNILEVRQAYFDWWVEYVEENDLIGVLRSATGLSDKFGQRGHTCQAEVLWIIRKHWTYLAGRRYSQSQ